MSTCACMCTCACTCIPRMCIAMDAWPHAPVADNHWQVRATWEGYRGRASRSVAAPLCDRLRQLEGADRAIRLAMACVTALRTDNALLSRAVDAEMCNRRGAVGCMPLDLDPDERSCGNPTVGDSAGRDAAERTLRTALQDLERQISTGWERASPSVLTAAGHELKTFKAAEEGTRALRTVMSTRERADLGEALERHGGHVAIPLRLKARELLDTLTMADGALAAAIATESSANIRTALARSGEHASPSVVAERKRASQSIASCLLLMSSYGGTFRCLWTKLRHTL